MRVQEGYTCDCFEGFQLDMARMACVGKFSNSDSAWEAAWPMAHFGAARLNRTAGEPTAAPYWGAQHQVRW